MRLHIAALLGLTAFGCGARSPLRDEFPDREAGFIDATDAPPDVVNRPRVCPPNCTIGHQCCIGGCGDPAASMPSDCCSCLVGETESSRCPRGTCGR